VFERRFLVGPERLDVHGRSVTRGRRKFLPWDEPPTVPQRDQFADPVAVAGDNERLPILDGIHDLFGSVAEITLGDLRLCSHASSIEGV
jgi:hypothetical protein